ncbi:hypothetical protein ACP4OV_008001 [Aristida adscensionis]
MKLKNSRAEIFRHSDPIFISDGKFGPNNVVGGYGVRPNEPAVVQTRCNWIIGDVTEVLDRNTWKLGKILKMLKNNYFVIRLADCIQLKEFHISSLRIPHTPGAPHTKLSPEADKAPGRGKRPPAGRASPRSRAVQQIGRQAHEVDGNGRKRKAAAEASHHLSRRAPPRQLAMADSYPHSPSQAGEDPECSVASCSVNNGGGKRHAAGAGAGGWLARRRLFPDDDAMSACACTTSGREEEDDDEEEEEEEDDEDLDGEAAAAGVDVHGLELAAYRSTMRALYASGPLTWEQESLLTNLRLSLNISNEEHLLQLRRLLSSSSSSSP